MESSRKARASLAHINGEVNSSISGIRVTKAFNNSNKELEKFEIGNKGFVEAKRSQYKTMSLLHASSNLLTDIFNVICLISGGIFLYKGQITFGDYSTFIVSINVFITPIQALTNLAEQFEEGITGFERFIEIMDEPIEEDKPNSKAYKHLNGDIEFKKVFFTYNKDEENEILNDVSFKLKKGRTTIVVAHRLSTIKNADEILVISNGKVKERGTHNSLLKKNSIYKKLYDSQFKNKKLILNSELM